VVDTADIMAEGITAEAMAVGIMEVEATMAEAITEAAIMVGVMDTTNEHRKSPGEPGRPKCGEKLKEQ
jgi:hypothetical protein